MAAAAAPSTLSLADNWPLPLAGGLITLQRTQAARDAAIRLMHESQGAASVFVPQLECIEFRFAPAPSVGDFELDFAPPETARNRLTPHDLVFEELGPQIGGIRSDLELWSNTR